MIFKKEIVFLQGQIQNLEGDRANRICRANKCIQNLVCGMCPIMAGLNSAEKSILHKLKGGNVR